MGAMWAQAPCPRADRRRGRLAGPFSSGEGKRPRIDTLTSRGSRGMSKAPDDDRRRIHSPGSDPGHFCSPSSAANFFFPEADAGAFEMAVPRPQRDPNRGPPYQRSTRSRSSSAIRSPSTNLD